MVARQVEERVDWVSRRASFVVWALAREAVSWRRERGGIEIASVVVVLLVSSAVGAAVDVVDEVAGVVRREREDWQCLMSARRELTEDCSRSISAVRDDGGMLVNFIYSRSKRSK